MSNSKKFQDYWFVGKDDQALATGNIVTTGNSANIADGQLGIIVAEEVAHLNVGDCLTATNNPAGSAANEASDVPAIKIVQGTPNSANHASNVGWFNEDKNYVVSPIIRNGNIKAFAAKIAPVESFSAILATGFVAPTNDNEYSIYTTLDSVRKDRDYGRNQHRVPPAYFKYSTISGDTIDYLLMNLAYKYNRFSKWVTNNPPHNTNEAVCLAIDISGGGEGIQLGDMELGDTVPFMVKDGVTHSFTVTEAVLQTIYNTITNTTATAASTIEVIDLTNDAGSGLKAKGTITAAGNFTANDQVTIGATTYTFVASPSSANDVDLGATAAASIQNLVDAINANPATSGTAYHSGTTANASVEARVKLDDTSVVELIALTAGTAGNSIVLTEDVDGGTTWSVSGSGTLAGGAAATDGGKVDALLFIGLEEDQAAGKDLIWDTKARIKALEFGRDFTTDMPAIVKTTASDKMNALGSARVFKIKWEESGSTLQGTHQLAGYSDTLILPPNYIVDGQDYTVYTIDVEQEIDTLTIKPNYKFRINILLPATKDTATTDSATGVTASTNDTTTNAALEAVLGAWLKTANAHKLLGDATASTYFA